MSEHVLDGRTAEGTDAVGLHTFARSDSGRQQQSRNGASRVFNLCQPSPRTATIPEGYELPLLRSEYHVRLEPRGLGTTCGRTVRGFLDLLQRLPLSTTGGSGLFAVLLRASLSHSFGGRL